MHLWKEIETLSRTGVKVAPLEKADTYRAVWSDLTHEFQFHGECSTEHLAMRLDEQYGRHKDRVAFGLV